MLYCQRCGGEAIPRGGFWNYGENAGNNPEGSFRITDKSIGTNPDLGFRIMEITPI